MEPAFNDSIFEKGKETAKGITTLEVTKHLKALKNNTINKKGLFLVKEAAQWIDEAKNRPIPKMLFSEFWHEGELCICLLTLILEKVF